MGLRIGLKNLDPGPPTHSLVTKLNDLPGIRTEYVHGRPSGFA